MTCMNEASFLRGHPIFFKDGEWFYEDSNTPTIGNERDCGYCGRANNKKGHDGCLGTLPHVMNACCGHGMFDKAYIQFPPYLCSEDLINGISRMLRVWDLSFTGQTILETLRRVQNDND